MKVIIIDVEGNVDVIINVDHIIQVQQLEEFRFYQADSTYYPFKIKDIVKIEVFVS